MQPFEEWWDANKHTMPHIVKIDAREAYKAALTAANERISVLERDIERLNDGWNAANVDLLERDLQLTAEREISDKLEKALKGLLAYNPRMEYRGGAENGTYHTVGSALLKVLDQCEAALAEASNIRNSYELPLRANIAAIRAKE